MITFTQEQQDACQKLVEFMLSTTMDERCIILQGHAGTGKTTIINEAVEQAIKANELLVSLDNNRLPMVAHFTAMTHKAKHALSQRVSDKVTTLHKFLGIIPNKPAMAAKSLTPAYIQIIIVDECSYIDYDVLKAINMCMGSSPTAKFIFMGDNYQLTPVGLNHCPIFMQGYPVVTLETVMRQQNAPIIAKASHTLRQAIKQGYLDPINSTEANNELMLLDKKAWDKAMITAFKSDKAVKVIRYSNHQVKQTNNKMFKHFTKRKEMQVGDTVINNSFYNHKFGETEYKYFTSTSKAIYADTELIISSINPSVHTSKLGRYKVNAITAHDPHTGENYKLYAPQLGECNPKTYDNRLLFADLRPAFACTVHKSQGSTYDEVFINLNDFKNAYLRNPKETFRLLYVAFSRAKSKVYVTGDIV
ncbi:ATP-dependent DNA helicase [Moraxella sp. ZY200743]|uniref:ATP-dependent DNA helicase n=1 Tax=Moraxella sp. ZY200743 TaxID=2911970 RepID=UPI003D7C94D1